MNSMKESLQFGWKVFPLGSNETYHNIDSFHQSQTFSSLKAA